MTTPSYGTVHRARVLRVGDIPDTYVIEVPALAPDRAWGPVQSATPDLAVGDRVLVTQVGLSQSDLVVTGKLPPTPFDVILPIDIADVTGLQTALNSKADDADVSGLDTRLTAAEGVNTTQNGRLTSIESLNTTQDGRLGAIETLNTTQDGRLSAIETLNTTQDGRLTSLEDLQLYQEREEDLYGDKLSSLPRALATTTQTLTNGLLYGQRFYARRAISVTALRLCVATTAGVGGGAQMALYVGTATSSLSLVAFNNITLTALGVQSTSITYSVPPGRHVVVMLAPFSFSTAPKIATSGSAVAHSTLLAPSNSLMTSMSKTSATFPSTINLGDGTWTVDTSVRWFAIA